MVVAEELQTMERFTNGGKWALQAQQALAATSSSRKCS